ncbi:MAG: UDP-N-acetylmuramoyl-L-alanyl-D-glutamate--2,6-diaminopimelate ligase [Anaerolineae bacterium]|nr:UDP-N-acetylmuramoyl-L-alanyl-D-glutamate--2,6-diaminopimelate ligase [Anaerolineae bacterium]
MQISHITADSRRVSAGALFVAYRGVGVDGHRYIGDALARGAAAIVGELAFDALSTPPPAYIQVADGREALAWLSAAWHDHPSRAMALVGITGTDGKTTTANLLHSILVTAGKRAGLISTVSAVIGDQTYETGLHTTTPDAPDVQRYLAKMRDAGTEIAVLEATSHGLAQHRVTGCAFDIAVVTNITHEHLDFHGSYEAYRDAKALLFRSLSTSYRKPGLLKTAILNRDDSSFDYLAALPAERRIVYGAGERESGRAGELMLVARNVRHQPFGTEFDLTFASSLPFSPSPIHLVTALVGRFNVSNVLAAAGAALALGIDAAAIAAGVRALRGVPGRMERVDRGQPFTAIVDFAHTPNALAKTLETLRTLVQPGGRLIAVFGSAGLRDREKRRLMGIAAARLADMSVITAEDPRTEDLAAILAETAAAMTGEGRREGQDFARIPDRQRAILHAVGLARTGDVIVVCGKGHEQSMCFDATEHPWRDQAALAWALDAVRDNARVEPPFLLPTWST